MRDYSLLEDIYWGDIEKIQSEYGTKEITTSEYLFALDNYALIPNELNFEITNMMFNGVVKNKSKDEISELCNATLQQNNCDFFFRISDNNHIQEFLADYKESISDNWKYSNKIQTLLKNIEANPIQKKFQAHNEPTDLLINHELRIAEPIDEITKLKLHQIIEIKSFKKAIHEEYPITKVRELIENSKKALDLFLNKEHDPEKFSMRLFYFPSDIVDIIATDPINEITTNLWKNISRGDINNIQNSYLESCLDGEIPKFIEKMHKGPYYKSSWALLENGIMTFGGNGHQAITNGEDVITAGNAFFAEDGTKLVALTNQSGHYAPTLESLKRTVPYLEKNGIDTKKIIMADYCWNHTQLLSDPIQVNISKAIKNMQKIRDNALATQKSTNSLTKNIN